MNFSSGNRVGVDPLHPDVMIQSVDVIEICLGSSLDSVDADVHPQPLGILRRCEANMPEREYEQPD
jgi:hypothetical protein